MKSKLLSVLILTFLVSACAKSSNDGLEEARFALDSGNWGKAVTEALGVLTDDPTNVEAALLLSGAYAGRAGVTILPVSADIAEAENSNNEFAVVHNAVVSTVTDLNDLRNAVEALSTLLTPQPESTHDLYTDQQFQLGMIEAIEAFALSSITAQPQEGGAITPTAITAEHKANIQNDFLNADDHLINAGMAADDDLVFNIRKTYCVLKNASASATGFDLEVLQDLNLCQLTDEADRDALTSAGGDFQSPNITLCSDFDFDACADAPDTAL